MKSCLVVEDSAVVRQIGVRIVQSLGLTTRDTSSAAEAVELCRTQKPDVVLLDWDLPTMGALDFLRGIGSFDADQRPPIILCATEHDPQQFVLAKAAGAAHYILKPFDKETVAAKLAEIGVLDRLSAVLGSRAAS
jgi:two-component system chemotaxis response regulator CheY